MQIKNSPISYKARIVIESKSVRKHSNTTINYVKNTKPKQGLLTKLMTRIIKPLLKSKLKTPS